MGLFRMLNGLDLFSGIGGLSVALADWVRPIAYCEIDRYAQGVLLSRMSDGSIPTAPIWDNVESLSSKYLPEIDIIAGGFPCQDISCAGNGVGLGGERSGLYWELYRLIKETRAPWVFLENVPAIRTRGLLTVVRSLTDLGYDCRWTCVSAAEVGAPHLRKRWFLLAYSYSKGVGENCQTVDRRRESGHQKRRDGFISECKNMAYDANIEGSRESIRALQKREAPNARGARRWKIEPRVGRVANGIPARVDRIKGLGNAVVPLQAKTAFERLMGIQSGNDF